MKLVTWIFSRNIHEQIRPSDRACSMMSTTSRVLPMWMSKISVQIRIESCPKVDHNLHDVATNIGWLGSTSGLPLDKSVVIFLGVGSYWELYDHRLMTHLWDHHKTSKWWGKIGINLGSGGPLQHSLQGRRHRVGYEPVNDALRITQHHFYVGALGLRCISDVDSDSLLWRESDVGLRQLDACMYVRY